LSKESESWPLLIPIGVLLLVFIGTGVFWILIPVFVLFCVFFGSLNEDKKIQRAGYSYSEGITQPTQEKPIYDRKKQKDEGIAFGILIPVAILLWLFFESLSWIFLIPVFFLLWSFFESVLKNLRGQSDVRDMLRRGDARTIPEISSRTGLPEEQVRRHIVREKRSGSSDVWFNPSTGERMSIPMNTSGASSARTGCRYCGFALRDDDRFCPYCGAPIKADE
jgi:hypothetical protein